jgi:two-component system sensor histidine kinase RegB
VAQLRDAVLPALGEERAARLRWRDPGKELSVRVPRQAFAQVLVNLVRNAFEASDDEQPVELTVERSGPAVRFTVRDQGHGMTRELLARAQEPFFTTKQAGQGLGLGLFLASALAEQLGGRLSVDSTPDRGTTASVEVPA